jgi:hypothetical protein
MNSKKRIIIFKTIVNFIADKKYTLQKNPITGVVILQLKAFDTLRCILDIIKI